MSAWFTKNPVAANLLALLVILGGLFTLMGIRIEGFPAIPPSTISIDVAYPDATAEQVDSGVSKKVEKALEGLAGVKKVTSISHENSAQILVKKDTGYDMDRLLSNVKNRVDGIDNFPTKAEKAVIAVDEYKDFALLVQIYGDVDEPTLQRSARLLEKELQSHPKVSKIETFGKKNREMRIEFDGERLKALGISMNQAVNVIRANRAETGFGRLKHNGNQILIRSDAKLEYQEQLMALPLVTQADGAKIFVRDVARIVDGYAEQSWMTRYQGQPSVGIVIYTSTKGHLIQVSEAAREVVARMEAQMPPGVGIDVWADVSVYMKNRLQLLQTNAWQGLLIVFVILAVFLDLKLAFWVSMGIPFSVAGTVALMGERFLNYSLNDLTTFGMIIVLGILVDDAVVVGESVFESRSRNRDPIDGTIQGVHKVAVATVFGMLTTVAAFYPLTLIQNDFGKILSSFAVVVCVALLFSLVESKLVLPAHLASISIDKSKNHRGIARAFGKLQSLAGGGLDFVTQRLYSPLLRQVLRHRYTALVIFITVGAIGGWAMQQGYVRTVFFPEIPGDVVTVTAAMEKGSTFEQALANANRIERAAQSLNTHFMDEFNTEHPPITRIMTSVDGSDSITMYAELQPQDQRTVDSFRLMKLWRKEVGVMEGITSIQFNGSSETGGGFVINVESRNSDSLKEALGLLKPALAEMDGVHDLRDDLKAGAPEIRLRIKDEARHLGLTPLALASRIGGAFGGVEIDKFQKGEDEIKLKVLLGRDQRRHLYQLLDSRITLDDGSVVPLTAVAHVSSRYAVGYIHRINGKRVVEVKAALDRQRVSAAGVMAALQASVIPDIESRYPDVKIKAGGELEEEGKMQAGLYQAMLLILVLIYALLAVPLKSYWKPFVIMSVIPFGVVGALAGHWIQGIPLSLLSFFGMLALSGIVVNDSLVMLTRFNDILGEGKSVREALETAGSSRFRAIFLTTATTVCGLLPLLTETSEQAQYLIPAGVSLAYGEMFATFITLLLIPLLMNIAYDIIQWWPWGKSPMVSSSLSGADSTARASVAGH